MQSLSLKVRITALALLVAVLPLMISQIINAERTTTTLLGNYAKYIFSGNLGGILRQRGHFLDGDIGDGYVFPVLFTVHPAYCIYNRDEGMAFLNKDIKLFRERTFERRHDEWLLDEDDFKL